MISHAKFLDQLIRRKGNLLNFAGLMNRKKIEYDTLIKKYRMLLQKLDFQEKGLKLEKKKFSDLNDSSFASDLNRNQSRANFDRKIQHCLSVKTENY